MFEEDFLPQKKSPPQKKLTDMSIGELKDYIEELKSEIKRAEADIEKKQASLNAAASIFKS